MSDEIEEQFDLYKQRSLSRAFKINQLNKKINAKTDLIIRLKQKIKQNQDRLKDAEDALIFYSNTNDYMLSKRGIEYFEKYRESDE